MHPDLKPLSYKEGFTWTDSVPANFKGIRLPGSRLASATGSFGSICIQEFQSEDFSIRLNVHDLAQQLILVNDHSHGSGFHSRILLKGQVSHQLNRVKWELHPNQFSLIYAEGLRKKEIYDKNLHISFDTFFSFKWVRDILRLFTAFEKRMTAKPLVFTSWSDVETLELVQHIIHCKYEKGLRRHFFESRIRDLFFRFLMLSGNDRAEENEPSEKDVKAIYEAEQIINRDITVHISIPELSKKVLLNEFSLKRFFKKIFGMGPYEYLVWQRMKKAKELLAAGLSVKEVAAQTGYRPTGLIVAFSQFYGFTPGSVKK